MLRKRLILIVAVLAAACSSGGSGGLRTSTTSATTDTSSTDTGATDTGSSGSLPSEADLKSALLSEDDLPSGFTKDTSSDSSDNSNTDVHAKGATCDAAFQKLQQKATKHKVTVDFKHDDTEFVSQEVAARSGNAAPSLRPTSRTSQIGLTLLTIAPFILALITCATLLTVIAPRGGSVLIQADVVALTLFIIVVIRQALT